MIRAVYRRLHGMREELRLEVNGDALDCASLDALAAERWGGGLRRVGSWLVEGVSGSCSVLRSPRRALQSGKPAESHNRRTLLPMSTTTPPKPPSQPMPPPTPPPENPYKPEQPK